MTTTEDPKVMAKGWGRVLLRRESFLSRNSTVKGDTSNENPKAEVSPKTPEGTLWQGVLDQTEASQNKVRVDHDFACKQKLLLKQLLFRTKQQSEGASHPDQSNAEEASDR